MLYTIINIAIKAIEIIFLILSVMYCFRVVFAIVGFFTTKKYKPAKKMHKYAILIAARNEESVIANLIHSIKMQDYPSELVTIFVVADNCNDKTAEISRKCGAICYERKDTEHRTKGFALQYLVECIRKDYGIESFEAYFIFDADNLLNKDYISRMNDSFDAGEKIITSYRNTKNFDDNWISASYALHWIRTIRVEHRARSVFGLATRVQGTGYMFSNELIKDGWNYTGFTEDRAFCADVVTKGYSISYNDAAEFYDEQPNSIKIALRQRIRWSKGHIQAFGETGAKLFINTFKGNNDTPNKCNKSKLRIMSLDMLSIVFPRSLFDFFKNIVLFILKSILIIGGALTLADNFSVIQNSIFSFLGFNFDSNALIFDILFLGLITILSTLAIYSLNILVGIYVFIMEREHIKKIKWYKKLYYCLTFPLFDLIGKIAIIIAFFSKVEWKPIPHNVVISIDDIEKENVVK